MSIEIRENESGIHFYGDYKKPIGSIGKFTDSDNFAFFDSTTTWKAEDLRAIADKLDELNGGGV